MSYQVAHLDELARVPVAHGLEWRPIRRRFGGRAFGVNAYTAEKPGDWVVEEHTEEPLGHEELYLVLRGRARFTLDGEEVDAAAGTLVFVRNPAVKRSAIAEDEETVVLAVGAKPGAAFDPSPWEWYFEAYEQPTEEGIATIRSGIEELGERGPLYYHLACLEARAGRLDEARAHLDRALDLDPALREYVQADDDLKEVL
jgi:quercetin dioxygenase-like cupin family protein